MPRNAKQFVRRIRIDEEDLQEHNADYYLNAADNAKLPKLRKDGRMFHLARKVYEYFITDAEKNGKPRSIPTLEIDDLLEGASRVTAGRVKKTIGSRSLRKAGVWYWSFPRRSPEKARQAALDRLIKESNPYAEELSKRHRPVCKDLEEVMRMLNFQATNTAVLSIMNEQFGYSRRTTLLGKATLGIATLKRDGVTSWVWPGPEVVQWLTSKLSHGPVLRRQLEFEAKAERDWDFDLIVLAREVRGGVTWSTRNGAVVWTDINQTPPPPVLDTTVEIDNNIYTDERDREVIVDFSGEYTDHELAPDEAIADATPPAPRQITVGDIKLEIFE